MPTPRGYGRGQLINYKHLGEEGEKPSLRDRHAKRCRYIVQDDNKTKQCSEIAVDQSDDAIIELCRRHLGQAARYMEEQLRRRKLALKKDATSTETG
jgi:hypothetical protein